MADFDRESMLEMFTYETNRLLEELEQNVIKGESGFSMDEINEIFRIMHTIKGSASMMMFDSISKVAHVIEDLFFYLREENPTDVDYGRLADHVLEGMDFIKVELAKIEMGEKPDGDGRDIIQRIGEFLKILKSGGDAPAEAGSGSGSRAAAAAASQLPEIKYSESAGQAFRGTIWFQDGAEMENIRAYTFIHNFGDTVSNVAHIPTDIIDEHSAEHIKKHGFAFQFNSHLPFERLDDIISSTIYLKNMEFDIVDFHKQEEHVKEYKAKLTFDEGSEMENIRAYNMINKISDCIKVKSHIPADLLDEDNAEVIKKSGFTMVFTTALTPPEIEALISETIYLRTFDIIETGDEENMTTETVIEEKPVQITQSAEIGGMDASYTQTPQASAAAPPPPSSSKDNGAGGEKKAVAQHVISVNVSKLDSLLNLMGELVIAEAMVTQNPELEGLELESFVKEARQLHKIINDIQDTVMSMRMVPLQSTFFKMHRIVRDMCRQLNKEVDLIIIGEDTEVDKNIIEHISDPLMHIIRNAVDHGIEKPEERKAAGKTEKGKVILEAKNTGGDVLIIIKDDGYGLNRAKILNKAKVNGLLRRDESEYSDKEIQQFIFLPGFSTNETVTSFSGRGVGMDVVNTNLELVGGSVSVDSTLGEGTTFTMKIPLTLAIIEGMTIRMGGAKYTIPIISMKKSFKATENDIFKDPSGNEMITERGEVYNVVRLYEFFGVESEITKIEDGIMVMLENGEQTVCLFVDDLIGEQQVVVKSMPKYIKKIRGISGCTLLGNGDISLIIDVGGFFDK